MCSFNLRKIMCIWKFWEERWRDCRKGFYWKKWRRNMVQCSQQLTVQPAVQKGSIIRICHCHRHNIHTRVFHLRTTILPAEEDMPAIMSSFKQFNHEFMNQYEDN